MKRSFVLLVSIVSLAHLPTARAVDLAGGSVSFDFASQPSASDFSTITNGILGAPDSITGQAELDAAIQQLVASAVATGLPISSTTPPSNNAAFRYNSNLFAIQSRMATAGAGVLLATLENSGPNYISDVGVSYDLTVTGAGPEEIPHHRVYFSATGAANSWTPMGNFGSMGQQSFNVSNLGTSFGNNPVYVLWADDNGSVAGTEEFTFVMDNVNVTRTLGDSIAPGGGFFGTRVDWGIRNYEANSNLDVAFENGGEVISEPGSFPAQLNHALHLSNGDLSVLTEQVDLRARTGTALVSIDVKVFEDSPGTDFELEDFLHVIAEYSQDGRVFTPIDMIPRTSGGSGPGDPGDALKQLEVVTNGGAFYASFSVILPQSAETVRLRILAANDSDTEHFYFDNFGVYPTLEPEPASVIMFGLGMLGLVSYRVRRRPLH